MRIDFVIPHMGRENMLVQTLASIANLDTQEHQIRVVLVSKNKTLSQAVLAFRKLFEFQFIHADAGLNISQQRNMGAKQSNSEYLAFLDADVELARNWLSAMLKKLTTHPEIALVSAVQHTSKNPTPLEQLRCTLSNAKVDCELEFLPGRNLLLSRTNFINAGGFPEHLITCEDYVFTQTVSKYGKLFYTSDSHYVHIGEDKEFWPMVKKEVWRGQSNLASLRGRSVPLSEWPSFFAPPLFTFGLILGLILALFGKMSFALVFIFGALTILMAYALRLRRIAKGTPSFFTILKFYLLYFPARTWGTIKGWF